MGSETNASSVEVGTGSGNGAAAVELETEKSRRALLKGLGVAAAGAVVGGVLSPEEAKAHGTFHRDSNSGDPAIHGHNTIAGIGVSGTSVGGTGVFGLGAFVGLDGVMTGSAGLAGVLGDSSTTGVLGRGETSGVEGQSNSGIGVKGSSESLIGVNGTSPNGIAVAGFSENGIGVDGNGGNVGVVGGSESGTGVVGSSTSGTGVLARTFGSGLALDVHGPAKFSTAGTGVIPANQNSVVVNDPAVTADSHITMTLTGNPGSVGSGLPAVVAWIERQPGTGFIARLSRKVTNATPFTYLVVEPG